MAMDDIAGSVASHMQGGVDEILGLPQISEVTIGGTPEVGDRYTISLGTDTNRRNYGAGGNPTPPGEFALSFKSKVYAVGSSLLFFSDIDDPGSWNADDTGAGFINMANQAAGSEKLVSLATYFDRLAIFSRRAVQIWFVDVDPGGNTQLQVLNNTGTLAPKSVVSFGDTDVFYLSDSGVRSLRARDSSNAAFVSDIGNPIDTLIRERFDELDQETVAAAVAVIEPVDGRYWLAIGDRMYVFSFFPASKISAWTTYELGFTPTEMVAQNDKVYVRDTDGNIYVYGGEDGQTYDDCEVSITLPFMDGGDPAAFKSFYGLDLACTGTWQVQAAFDPELPAVKETVAIVNKTTYNDQSVVMAGRSSHMALTLTNQADGPALISHVAVHFQRDVSS